MVITKKNSYKNLLLFIVTFVLILNITLQFRCGTDFLPKIEPAFVSVKTDNSRNLDDIDYTSIKIMIDPTYMKSQTIEGITTEVTNTIVNLLNDVANMYSSLLSVIHYGPILIGESVLSSCGVTKGDSTLLDLGVDKDLVIFPYYDTNLTSTVQAAAGCCAFDMTHNKRPLLGFIKINPTVKFVKGNSEIYLKYLFLHEMAHVLVFHEYMFKNLWVGNVVGEGNNTPLKTITINGINRNIIASKNVLEKAKAHFGCDSIEGVELENQGGSGSAGSHWEARVMLGDYMISFDYGEYVISDITLALFEDSGWYKVNYYTGGLFRFGKGMGCEFLQRKCIYSGKTAFTNDFCTVEKEDRCTAGRTGKGYCYLGTLKNAISSEYQYFGNSAYGGYEAADYCPITTSRKNDNYYYSEHCQYGMSSQYPSSLGETLGKDSICAISSLTPKNDDTVSSYKGVSRPTCYKLECNYETGVHYLIIGSDKIQCPREGGTVSNLNNYDGELKCPDFNLVCTSEQICNDILDCLVAKQVTKNNSNSYNYNPSSYDPSVDLGIEDNGEEEEDTNTTKSNSSSNICVSLLILILILFLLK